MIPAAIQTPRKIVGIAFFSLMSSIAATRAPVQAPVPGSGTATKMHKPKALYFLTSLPLICAFFSRLEIIQSSRSLRLLSQEKIFLI